MKVSKFKFKLILNDLGRLIKNTITMLHIVRIIILLIICNLHIYAKPVGWYDSIDISNKTQDYSVYKNGSFKNQSGIYIVTEHLLSAFKENQITNLEIKLHVFNGTKSKSFSVQKVKLEPASVLFPLHPTTAVFKNKIAVAWQETDFEKGGTVIKYIFSDSEEVNFKKVEILNSTNNKTTILPYLTADENGNFHLFYQEETVTNHFTLMHAVESNGKFIELKPIISDVKQIGRGIFFPSVVMEEDEIHLLYQNRLQKTFKDEIFHVYSTDLGESYENPIRLTNNDYNDFSPFAVKIDNNIEWVWQSHEKQKWSIYYGRQDMPVEQVSNTNANCYLPVMAHLPKTGRIMAWHDFRESPSQIYGIYFNKKNTKFIGEEHNISKEKNGAQKPYIVAWQDNIYLFYLSKDSLIVKKADTEAVTPKIYSTTHPENLAVNQSKAIFKWDIPYEPSEIESYAYILDNIPDTIPQIYNLETKTKQIMLDKLSGGVHYLHLKYKDKAGNESLTAHYPFIIDATPPSAPLISSSSHPENTGSEKNAALMRFDSIDDAGIKRYFYEFSKNRGAKLTKSTTKTEVLLENIKPGNYFFLVQAEDMAGNLSNTAAYEVIVTTGALKDYFLLDNIVSGQLTDKDYKITVIPQKKIIPQKIYINISSETQDPFTTGKEIDLEKTKEGFAASFPVSSLKEGLYTVSIGILFSDGKQSDIENSYFERIEKKEPIKRLVLKKEEKKIKKRFIGEKSIPNIDIKISENLYEITFSVDKNFSTILKGYTWQLTRRPEIPKGKINSLGGPEYLYNLKPGVYYLTVKPLYSIKKWNTMDNYSYVRIEIEPYISKKMIIITGILGVFTIFFLTIAYKNTDLLRYRLSKFLHEKS
ncbi:MAG: hypothetical protein OEZ22_08220 [Spirochaetia bacterium]|nr:hypothetical protein [Spirochaetia bacterium]